VLSNLPEPTTDSPAQAAAAAHASCGSKAGSPFVLGVIVDPAIDPLERPRLRAALENFLAEMQRRLTHTELRLVLAHGAHGSGLVAEVAAAQELTIEVTGAVRDRCGLLLTLWGGSARASAARPLLQHLELCGEGDLPEEIPMQDARDAASAVGPWAYWIPAAPGGGVTAAPAYLSSDGEHILHLGPRMPDLLEQQLAHFDEFNGVYQQLLGRPTALPDSLLAPLESRIPAEDVCELAAIDGPYRQADLLAAHYQFRSDRLFLLFGCLAFAMGLAYLVYDKFGHSRALLATYAVLMLLGFAVYHGYRDRMWLAKQLANRALSETLRTLFYMRLAGLDHRLEALKFMALSGIESFAGFGWLRAVLATVPAAPGQPTQDRGGAQPQLVQAWVKGQCAYFERQVARLEQRSRRLRLLRNVLFACGFAVFALMLVLGSEMDSGWAWGTSLRDLLTFGIGILATGIGAWELHAGKMATRELLWQYRHQRQRFGMARARLERSPAEALRAEVLSDLARGALMDNYLWAIHRYHREHRPPGA
jgi:hypothetical protein